MKSLNILKLLILTLIQLCLASDEIMKDKRFPIYDYLATKANEYTNDELIELGTFFAKVWTEIEASVSSQEIENHKFFEGHKDYQALEEAIKQYTEAVENLKFNQINCDLRINAEEKRYKVYSSESLWKWSELDKYKKAEENVVAILKEHLKTQLEEIFEELPKMIETFLSNLSEEDKKNELVLWCQMFLEANSTENKLITLLEILKHGKNFSTRAKLESGKCKWNVTSFYEAFLKMKYYAESVIPHLETKKNLAKFELDLRKYNVPNVKNKMSMLHVQYETILDRNCNSSETNN